MPKFPPVAAGGEVGGLYGINVETLAGDKTLTPDTDEIYQYLDEGGANRTITLSTVGATAGDRFIIRHNGNVLDTHYLEVKQGAAVKDQIFAGAIKEFIFDGTNWISRGVGTGDNTLLRSNYGIGYKANCYNGGVAIGEDGRAYNYGVGVGFLAWGYQYGVAVGDQALGYNYGVGIGQFADGHDYGASVGCVSSGYTYGAALGYSADGRSYGVALGYQTDTNSKKYSIALGCYSETERVGETSVNINGDDTDQENNVVQGRWEGQLAGGAGATEIFCAGQANERFTIRASSHLAFRITVVARDNVANEGAMYTFEGLIRRDGANNTVMSVCNKTVVHEDDAAWDCDVTADDVNEAIIITCTGDAANITQWAAVLNGVETHF